MLLLDQVLIFSPDLRDAWCGVPIESRHESEKNMKYMDKKKPNGIENPLGVCPKIFHSGLPPISCS